MQKSLHVVFLSVNVITRRMKLLVDDKTLALDNAPHTRASSIAERFIRINLIDYGKYFARRYFIFIQLSSFSIAVHQTSHSRCPHILSFFLRPEGWLLCDNKTQQRNIIANSS